MWSYSVETDVCGLSKEAAIKARDFVLKQLVADGLITPQESKFYQSTFGIEVTRTSDKELTMEWTKKEKK